MDPSAHALTPAPEAAAVRSGGILASREGWASEYLEPAGECIEKEIGEGMGKRKLHVRRRD